MIVQSTNPVIFAFKSVERELGSWRWIWEMGMGWVGGWVPALSSLHLNISNIENEKTWSMPENMSHTIRYNIYYTK